MIRIVGLYFHLAPVLLLAALSQDPDPKQVDGWVKQLASDDVVTRESAAKKLLECGEKVLPLLEKYAKSDDAEIRSRIADVVKRLKHKPWRAEDVAETAKASLKKDSKPSDWHPALKRQLQQVFDEIGEDGSADSLKFASERFAEVFADGLDISRKGDEKLERKCFLLDAAKDARVKEALLVCSSVDVPEIETSVVVCTGDLKTTKKLRKCLVIAMGKIEAVEIEDCIVYSGSALTCTRRAKHCTILSVGTIEIGETEDVTFLNSPKRKIADPRDERDVKKPMLPKQKE